MCLGNIFFPKKFFVTLLVLLTFPNHIKKKLVQGHALSHQIKHERGTFLINRAAGSMVVTVRVVYVINEYNNAYICDGSKNG